MWDVAMLHLALLAHLPLPPPGLRREQVEEPGTMVHHGGGWAHLNSSCLVATGTLKIFSLALFMVPRMAPRFT